MPVPKDLRETARQLRKARQDLRALTHAVSLALAHFDHLLAQPASYVRGKQLAQVVNALDVANDAALHFGLGYTFPAIAHDKVRLERQPRDA
jgi:hypothetical protein